MYIYYQDVNQTTLQRRHDVSVLTIVYNRQNEIDKDTKKLQNVKQNLPPQFSHIL